MILYIMPTTHLVQLLAGYAVIANAKSHDNVQE
jgi:hypothetical protein